MEKFLSWDFMVVLILAILTFVVHEYGHYLAYRILGIPAKLRRSFLVPGIDPRETVTIKRWKGLLIALGGFILSICAVIFPLFIFNYKHCFVLFLGAVAGSLLDFVWMMSMLGSKEITIHARGY